MSDVCALSMLGSFSDDVAEEEDELLESARADEARFRAFRCFFVMEAFSALKKVRAGLPLASF